MPRPSSNTFDEDRKQNGQSRKTELMAKVESQKTEFEATARQVATPKSKRYEKEMAKLEHAVQNLIEQPQGRAGQL